jgi:hypothetical protein
MRILTLGDSWTFGAESSDPKTCSWPAQMAAKYSVSVTNLARRGSSNQRQIRFGIEELCCDRDYDWVIFPLAPASRLEVLKRGKWHQVWPNALNPTPVDQLFTDLWHPWNDVQITVMLALQFLFFVKSQNVKILITGLSFKSNQYKQEMSWIRNYKGNNDFRALGMPLEEFDIGIEDLHRKLVCLNAMVTLLDQHQPDWWVDVDDVILQPHQSTVYGPGGHPNDNGYCMLADYFAGKIGLR